VEPTFSPDGTKIAFTSYRDGNSEIYVTSSTIPVPPMNLTKYPSSDTDPAFSPDGKKLTFTSNRFIEWDVFVMNSDGSAWDHRTVAGNYYEPDWGPRP
jgi:Tol biopolymer transport system component